METAVIIPCFNSAAWIGGAVDSVLSQTDPAAEIIVVNDGSTDASADVLRGFGDRIRVIEQKNQGLSAARNTGVRSSRAPWLSFLDADDQYEPEYLAYMQQLATAFPEAGILFSEYANLDRPEAPSVTDKYVPQLRSLAQKAEGPLLCFGPNVAEVIVMRNGAFAPSTLTVRRTVFDRAGGFFPGMRGGEDLDFYVHALPYATVAFAKHKAVRKRFHGASLGQDDAVMRPAVEIFWNRAQPFCRDHNPGLLAVVKRKYLGLLRDYARRERERARYDEAYSSYSQLLRMEPWRFANWTAFLACAAKRLSRRPAA